jgi:hypothetical protein
VGKLIGMDEKYFHRSSSTLGNHAQKTPAIHNRIRKPSPILWEGDFALA